VLARTAVIMRMCARARGRHIRVRAEMVMACSNRIWFRRSSSFVYVRDPLSHIHKRRSRRRRRKSTEQYRI